MDSTINCSNRIRLIFCCLLGLLIIPRDTHPMARLAQHQTTTVAVRHFTSQTPKMERRAVYLMAFLYCATPLSIMKYLDLVHQKKLREEREAATREWLENYEWKRKHCWTEARRKNIDGIRTGFWHSILVCDDPVEARRRGIKKY